MNSDTQSDQQEQCTDADEQDDAVGKLEGENPFAGADLVLYRAEAADAEVEPATDALQSLDLISWSLWARFEDDGVELPIVGESSNHVWYSLSPEEFHPDPATRVSEEFAVAVTQMVQGEGEDWGNIEEDVWEALPALERYVVNLVRHGFLMMECAEPALVIDWCTQQTMAGDHDD